jgi:nucleoid-associated protein YgaU
MVGKAVGRGDVSFRQAGGDPPDEAAPSRSAYGRGPPVPGAALPAYYARRLDALPPATAVSARRRLPPADPEAQAERLFRDFKLGLLTLVVVALVLVAYFWDGSREVGDGPTGAEEGVLNLRLSARPRSEVLAARRAPSVEVPTEAARQVPTARRDPGLQQGREGPLVGEGRSRERGAASERAGPPARGEDAPRAGLRPARLYAYVVKPGDTLSAIALRFYGDASRWRLIFESNRRRLRRPSDLRAGMRLLIPARARASAGRTGDGRLARTD